jgi:hypothetical protein
MLFSLIGKTRRRQPVGSIITMTIAPQIMQPRRMGSSGTRLLRQKHEESTYAHFAPRTHRKERTDSQCRLRVDASVLFLLCLGLLVFQIDRMNLASALTDGFAADIGVDQDTINLGNQLLFMGIVVLEIPCNMALQKVGYRPGDF